MEDFEFILNSFLSFAFRLAANQNTYALLGSYTAQGNYAFAETGNRVVVCKGKSSDQEIG